MMIFNKLGGKVMKKKVLAIIVMFLCFAGVVNASTSWGQYKDYNIVRITVNDRTIKATDIPAINFEGRTMVPIYMLQEAGVKYAWNDENRTVDVQNIDESIQHIDNLKKYSATSNMYKQLRDFEEQINSVKLYISLLPVLKSSNASNDILISETIKSISNLKNLDDTYNSLLKEIKNVQSYTGSYAFKVSSYEDIMKKYDDGLYYLNNSLSYLLEYFKNNRQSDFTNFQNSQNKSWDILSLAQSDAETGYLTFQKLIYD